MKSSNFSSKRKTKDRTVVNKHYSAAERLDASSRIFLFWFSDGVRRLDPLSLLRASLEEVIDQLAVHNKLCLFTNHHLHPQRQKEKKKRMASTNNASHDRTLYYLENSRAFRVAWLLEELDLPYHLRVYSRLEGKRAEPSLKIDSANPLGKSPYLVDSGIHIGESAAIVKYLISRYAPESQLLGSTTDWQQRADVEAWISFSEGMMVHTLAAVYPRWFADHSTASRIESSMATNIHNNLNHLEQSLAQNAGWLVGGTLTAADIMCAFSAEYTFGMDTAISSRGKTIHDWPNTVAWLKKCAQTQSYQRTLARGATHKFTLTD